MSKNRKSYESATLKTTCARSALNSCIEKCEYIVLETKRKPCCRPCRQECTLFSQTSDWRDPRKKTEIAKPRIGMHEKEEGIALVLASRKDTPLSRPARTSAPATDVTNCCRKIRNLNSNSKGAQKYSYSSNCTKIAAGQGCELNWLAWRENDQMFKIDLLN